MTKAEFLAAVSPDLRCSHCAAPLSDVSLSIRGNDFDGSFTHPTPICQGFQRLIASVPPPRNPFVLTPRSTTHTELLPSDGTFRTTADLLAALERIHSQRGGLLELDQQEAAWLARLVQATFAKKPV